MFLHDLLLLQNLSSQHCLSGLAYPPMISKQACLSAGIKKATTEKNGVAKQRADARSQLYALNGFKLAQVGLKLVQVGLKLAQVGLKLAQVGLKLAQDGLMLPRVGSSWPQVGSSWLQVGSSWTQDQLREPPGGSPGGSWEGPGRVLGGTWSQEALLEAPEVLTWPPNDFLETK